MKNFVQVGDIVEVVAPSEVTSGDIVVVGTLAGVAVKDAASGAPVNIQTRGVFDLPKTEEQAWTQGAAIYVTSAGLATTASSGNTLIGHAVADAANPSAFGRVRLSI